jgi:hypothetical protein
MPYVYDSITNHADNKQKSSKIMKMKMFATLGKAKPDTDNIRGLNLAAVMCMYILTDYRLILTKDTKDRLDLSSERADISGTELARTSSNNKVQTRPLLREDATKYHTAAV